MSIKRITLALSLTAALYLPADRLQADTNGDQAPETVTDYQQIPLDELRTFGEVFERIKQAYVHDIDDKTLLENAIRGMVSGLDPHSAYLTPEDYTELQESTQGEFGGLGLEVGSENGFIKVISPLDDTPAAKAGIRPHDLIIKIDDTPVRNLPLSRAIEMMRGTPGTEIRLTLMRDGEEAPFEITLTRDLIRVTSVKSRLLEDHFGYIRITQFQVHTGEEVVKALQRMHRNTDGTIKGVVLDLRNNPGGVLQAAAEVVDAFITQGQIVYTQGRIANAGLSFSATDKDPSQGVPLIVLINEGSASASEIVAGALQDHKRGIIMGTQSFGKGSVQTILPLGNEKGLKLTTALYYTPSGRSIQAQGITPDIEVRPARILLLAENSTIKEADLTGHLDSNPSDTTKTEAGKKTTLRQDSATLSRDAGRKDENNKGTHSTVGDTLSNDYQLFEAVSLLKALQILQPATRSDHSQSAQ